MSHDDHRFCQAHAGRLNDPRRLEEHLSEDDLVRLLDLHGDEDVADLGSGTGFYTDIVARHTSGTVYAVEVSPEMTDLYRERGVPPNVRLVEADVRELPLSAGSIDAAYSIVALHETAGDLGMDRLLLSLRTPGRVVVVDWRLEPTSWESGPPAARRISNEAALAVFEPYFETVTIEDLGSFMFALVARGRRATKT
jgi:SAM-dependent methyltransferase